MNQNTVLVSPKLEIPVFVSSVVQPFMVGSARPNRFLVRIEIVNVCNGKPMCHVDCGARSVPLPAEIITAPLTVFTCNVAGIVGIDGPVHSRSVSP